MEPIIVDTNVIVRYLIGEPEEQAEKSRRLFDLARKGEIKLLFLLPVIIESVYTLESFYQMSSSTVLNQLIKLMENPGVEVENRDKIYDALIRHPNDNVHVIDAFIAVTAAQNKYSVASFDRDLQKFNDIKCISL